MYAAAVTRVVEWLKLLKMRRKLSPLSLINLWKDHNFKKHEYDDVYDTGTRTYL